jgi:hypothetical protein
VASRWGYAVRAALFVAFVWYLYSVKYAPYRRQPYDEVLTTATVRAINAGHPFQLLFASHDGSPPTLMKMSEFYGDYGIDIPLSVIGSVARLMFGPTFQLNTSVARTLVLLLCLFTAAAMLSPPVPVAIGSAGVLSLWVLSRWGTLALDDARYWGVTFVAVVVAVYLGTVLKPWNRWRAAILLVLAGVAGYAQLLRQEAGPATYVAGLALVGAAAMIELAMRRSNRVTETRSDARALALRALAGGVLLIAVNASILPLERFCFSRAWGTPFSETPVAVHGDGWPLYLSLGYVSNPFNIGWRDPIGEVHARLINPAIKLNADPAFQRALLEEYERIVISRPWLLLRNLAAKAARVHELANAPSGANTGTIITQPPQLVLIYRAVPWVMLATLLLVAWQGNAEGVVVWFSSAALALGASAGPLLVFPEYIGGLQGATIALVFVVPAGVIGSLVFERRHAQRGTQAARRLIVAYGSTIASGILVGALFVSVQAWRYRILQAQTAAADPVAAVREQGFRYAHVFNDLPVTKQGRLIAQLQGSTDQSVARIIDERQGDFERFAPQVLVRTPSEIHLFVWMGRAFVPPLPRLFQGSTHASLLICGGCPPTASVNDIQLPLRWTMINDLEWQGRYRMFSVPSSPTVKDVPFFRVAAERTRALDTTLPTWMVPELISSARLAF